MSYSPKDANISLSRVKATGSTTLRSLQDRYSEVINVKDFGAVGDGVTDDTAAIQAAFNYVKSISCIGFDSSGNIVSVPTRGVSVVFPPGIYGVTSTITVPACSVYGNDAIIDTSITDSTLDAIFRIRYIAFMGTTAIFTNMVIRGDFLYAFLFDPELLSPTHFGYWIETGQEYNVHNVRVMGGGLIKAVHVQDGFSFLPKLSFTNITNLLDDVDRSAVDLQSIDGTVTFRTCDFIMAGFQRYDHSGEDYPHDANFVFGGGSSIVTLTDVNIIDRPSGSGTPSNPPDTQCLIYFSSMAFVKNLYIAWSAKTKSLIRNSGIVKGDIHLHQVSPAYYSPSVVFRGSTGSILLDNLSYVTEGGGSTGDSNLSLFGIESSLPESTSNCRITTLFKKANISIGDESRTTIANNWTV